MATASRWEELVGDDYADPRSEEQRCRDALAACRQAGGLGDSPQGAAFERELIAAIQARRSDRSDLRQFEVVTDERGDDIAVVRGELLVRAELAADPDAWALLAPYGFEGYPERLPAECPEGRGPGKGFEERVLRLYNPDLGPQRLTDVARLVRAAGYQASVSHIVPLGPVVKGQGGPEESTGREYPPAAAQSEPVRGVRVAVVDTGITDRPRSDRWLEGIDVHEHNVDRLDDLPGGGDGFLDYAAGHGTFAAGVVAQVAPHAEVAVYRAMDTDGIGSEVDVACSIVKAAEDGAAVINLSLGAQTLDDQPLLAIEAALELVQERRPDVLVVAAAGNYGDTRPCFPAASRRVVAVGGLTAALRASDWSSRGFWVNCSTVGQGVVSTYVEGIESPELDPDRPDTWGENPWAVWTGTSFAAPQVSGAVARILGQHERLTPRQALQLLLHGAPHVPDFGRAVRILPGS